MKTKFTKYLLVLFGIASIFCFAAKGYTDAYKAKRSNAKENLSKKRNALHLKRKNNKGKKYKRKNKNIYFNLEKYRSNAENLTITVNDLDANKDPRNIESVKVTVHSNAINDLVVVLNETSPNSGNFVGKIDENYLEQLKLEEVNNEEDGHIFVEYIDSGKDSEAIEVVKTPILTTEDIISLEEFAHTSDPRLYNTDLIEKFYIIEDSGGRVDWLQLQNDEGDLELDLIAFDKKGEDGYSDVYTMNPDGSNQNCLTCDKEEFQGRHVGNPDWHPSGDYIVFIAEAQGHPAYAFGREYFVYYLDDIETIEDLEEHQLQLADSFGSRPGWGYYCNLWAITPDGQEYWKLTHNQYEETDPMRAVLHQHFSHDGRKLTWAVRLGEGAPYGDWGEWAIKVADFDDSSGRPELKNERLYDQLGAQEYSFYETHDFINSPLIPLADKAVTKPRMGIDDKKIHEDGKILFSGNLGIGDGYADKTERHKECYLDIYSYNGEVINLTNTFDEWEEHAHYTPSGDKINYMSSEGLMEGVVFPPDWWTVLKTNFWMMKIDGSEKIELTYFNKRTHEVVDRATEKRYICSDSSWNADGSKLAVLVGRGTGPKSDNPFIGIIEFKEKQ